jgi:hypothetical protein
MYRIDARLLLGAPLLLMLAGPGCDDTTETTDHTTSSVPPGGNGGTAGAPGGEGGVGGAVCVLPTEPYVPTADDIAFTPLAEVPQGEQILFGTWSLPDAVWSMNTDGSNAVELFRTYRVWSMGAARGGDKLAFACGDPNQHDHYCNDWGDAIQHSWMYDFATQSVELLASGNINDECHTFTADDSALYVCRRYDFQPDGSNHSYRLGRIELPSKEFVWVTDPASPLQMDLHPQPTADGSALWFTRIDVEGTDQTRSIQRMTLPTGTPELIRNDANEAQLSPDGTRYLYADWTQGFVVYESDLDGQNAVLVANRAATSLTYSPDGQRVAYLVDDNGCANIEVVLVDGSQADTPTRIRDCAETGDFITSLAWIVRP